MIKHKHEVAEGYKLKRERYTWYLKQKRVRFDSSRWWQDKSDVDPIGALYEIARRHPLVLDARLGLLTLHNCHPLVFLSLDGLKSWPQLNWRKKSFWKTVAGNLKGVDCREDGAKCFSIGSNAFSIISLKRAFTTKSYQKKPIEVVSDLISKDMVEKPPTEREMGGEIKRVTMRAYREGYLLIAVAPDLAKENAESLMAKEYRQFQARNRIIKQRALPQSWLEIISEFEDDEIHHGGAKSQVFIRYRRVLDGIQFQ